MIGTKTLSNGKIVKEMRRFDMSKLEKVIEVFKTAIDIAEDINMEDEEMNKMIVELEKKLCVNTMQRIIFIEQIGIKFNVIKSKEASAYTVSYSNEDAVKYCKFLETLLPVVEQ